MFDPSYDELELKKSKLALLDKLDSILPSIHKKYKSYLTEIRNEILHEAISPGSLFPSPKSKKYRFVQSETLGSGWNNLLKAKPFSAISLYLNIPFCLERRCSFCREYSNVLTNPSDLKNYLGSLESEIDFFAPFFSGHPFFALYLGGGTPSVLSPFQLENLCNLINSKFSLEKNAEATIEMSPATVTRHKLEVASRGGFNRLSLGVQSMDRTVMEMNNRKYVGFDKMEKIFRDTKKANFEAFSADLIIGLTGDEMDKFLETLRFIIQMDPDEIVLYRLTCSPQEISIMDPIWRSKLIASLYPDCRGNRTISDKYCTAKYSFQEAYDSAERILNRSGYVNHEGVYPRAEYRFSKTLPHFRKTYGLGYMSDDGVLGLGAGSFSRIPGSMEYANISDVTSNAHLYAARIYDKAYRISCRLKEELLVKGQSTINISQLSRDFGCEPNPLLGWEYPILERMSLAIKNADGKLMIVPKNAYELSFIYRLILRSFERRVQASRSLQ